METTIPSKKADSLPALSSPKETGWVCKHFAMLGFQLSMVGTNPWLSRQVSITIPGGLTLMGLHSKRHGYCVVLNSDPNFFPKWSKKLISFL